MGRGCPHTSANIIIVASKFPNFNKKAVDFRQPLNGEKLSIKTFRQHREPSPVLIPVLKTSPVLKNNPDSFCQGYKIIKKRSYLLTAS